MTLFFSIHNGVYKGDIMEKWIRAGVAGLWTALLFTLFHLINTDFTISFWKIFPLFLLGIGGFGAVCYWLRKLLASGGRLWQLWDTVKSRYGRFESAIYAVVSDRVLFFALWAILSLSYIRTCVALFPGTFGYDAPVQIAQYYGEQELTLHHPLAHTFLMGFFFSLGEKIFHSYSVGFAMYTTLQGLAVTGGISYSLLVCKRRGVPLVWVVAGMLWAAVNPVIQALSFSSTKDILFGVFLLCFSAAAWEFAECASPGRGEYGKIAGFGILMCLFRNQGIYILLAMIVLCLLLRVGKKGLYICLSAVCLVFQVFHMMAAGLLGIPGGDRREMLCVPMQQAARVCYEYLNGGEVFVTPEQYEAVEEVISRDGILAYRAKEADPVKGYFQTDVLGEDMGKYLSAYAALGWQNPHEYLMAWAELAGDYWDMCGCSYRLLSLTYSFPEKNHWGIARMGLAEEYYYQLAEKIDAEKYPVLQRPESCIWLWAAAAGLGIACRRKALLAGTMPLGLYLGTMILGPVALLRYLFPLTIATPVLLGMLIQTRPAEEAYGLEMGCRRSPVIH